MDDFLVCRKQDELNLYNKFVGILNEKKLQIQHFSELLTAFRTGRPTVPQLVRVKNHTEDELPPPKRLASNKGRESPQPSTSKIVSPLSSDPESDNDISVEVKQVEEVNFNTQDLLNEL